MEQSMAGANQVRMDSRANRNKPLCLLVLDGGGVRGLSSLQILKQLMEFINPEQPPKPCDYFDMIGGTSTGGLIAIMLGRLQMSVDECMAEYQQISSNVFTQVRHRLNWRLQVQGRFDHEVLADKVREILVKRGLKEDELLKDPQGESSCRTFVCATSKETSSTAVLSSYFSQRRGAGMLNKVKIWEAARATSAATSFFNPITIGTESFVDGATGANNPINELWTEAYDIWNNGPGWELQDNIRCIVSIGTGIPTLKAFQDSPVDVAKALVSIALDTENVAETFQRHHAPLFQENRAFRFNVVRGLEDVGLEEASKQGHILAVTRRYFESEDVFGRLEKCSHVIQGNQNWLQWLFQNSDEVAQQAINACNDCTAPDHDFDELLLTYTSASPFVTWHASVGSILWCQKNVGSRHPHHTIACCICRQARSKSLKGPTEILYYRCEERCGDTAPTSSLDDGHKLGGPEAILRSFLSQAAKQGFVVTKKPPERKFHPNLLAYIIDILESALITKSCRVLFVVDSIELISRHRIADFRGSLGRLLAGRLGKMCSVLLGGETLPHLIEILKQVPSVNLETESNECLQSLYYDGYHARRDEVAVAIGNSNQWIWNHPAYIAWDNDPSGVLAVVGKPGSGKSVLAKTIQRRLSTFEAMMSIAADPSRPGSPGRRVASDWFYSKRKGKAFMSHVALLKAILYEFLKQDPSMFANYRAVYRRHTSTARSWSIDELEDILQQVASNGRPVLVVIDAIDEAEDDSLLRFIEEILQQPEALIKFIVLSRPSRGLDRRFWRSRQILLHYENSKDIEEIVDAGLKSIKEAMHYLDSDSEETLPLVQHGVPKNPKLPPKRKRNRPYNSEQIATQETVVLEQLRAELLSRANGVVLWIVLVIDTLLSTIRREIMFTFKELGERVKCLPFDLNRLYKEFIKDLGKALDPSGLAKARKTLMWVSAASELKPFTLEEVWDALAVPNISLSKLGHLATDPITQNRIPIRSWAEFARVLRGTCGPFVEVVRPSNRSDGEIGPDSVVQLMHQTVKDFLASPQDAGPLHFHQHEAATMVKNLTVQYGKIALPDFPTRYAPLPNSKWNEHNWKANVDDIAVYLDDKKLLSFCALLSSVQADLLVQLESNLATFRDGFILRKLRSNPSINNEDQERDDENYHSHNSPGLVGLNYLNQDFWGIPNDEIEHALGCETYDIGQGASSGVIGRLFHLGHRQGLVTLVKNLLSLSSLIDGWSENYQNTVLNATLFSVLDLRLNQYRQGLFGTGERLNKSVLALDHLYRVDKVSIPVDDMERQHHPWVLDPDLGDINQCINMVMDHKSFHWQRSHHRQSIDMSALQHVSNDDGDTNMADDESSFKKKNLLETLGQDFIE